MGWLDKAKAKIAYEKESYRMAGEQLKQVAEDYPYPPLRQRIRMTEADLEAWRRDQKKGKK